MHSGCFRLVLMSVLAGLGYPGAGLGEGTSRDRTTPGLILNTVGRTAACDALIFTADGKYLLAAGDDKVVRTWSLQENRLIPEKKLRWSIFREQRGAIYALALSPHETQVAIGGLGVRIGATVAVLDRRSGEVLTAATLPTSASVRAVTYSPSGQALACGNADGSVWIWRFKGDPQLLAPPHTAGPGLQYNHVRLLTFLDETRLLAVAEDGKVRRWNLSTRKVEELFQFDAARAVPRLFGVVLSPDHKWLAAAPSESRDSNQVELRSLDGRNKRVIRLPADDLPHSLAFDRSGSRLAVGIRTYPNNAPFFKNTGNKVIVLDLTGRTPKVLRRLSATYHPECLAFHPRENLLAVAGGANHEVVLWRLDGQRASRIARVRSPGSCLWSVGLSPDGRRLCFQEDMAPDPSGVNQRGSGPWRVFDLPRRRWVTDLRGIKRVEPIETLNGWKVDSRGAYTWHVLSPRGLRTVLPLDRGLDVMPRCYTFLRPAPGKTLRLAVGHYYGISIFELQEGQAPHRVRLYVGHEGEVMALAPSADGKLLVSASRDQTISAWSLADWSSHPELGARFVVKDNKVFVRRVDPGSPAWEANADQSRKQDGLAEGDEIALFAFNSNDFLYDPHNQIKEAERKKREIKRLSKSAEECLRYLERPVPGKQFHFRVKREGVETLLDLQTTVRQRPVWRFFPMRDGEWVLWRWRDYHYDTSTHGDRYIGWQVSGDVAETPQFYRAEQYRNRFHRPDKIQTVLVQGWEKPDRVNLPDIEPPEVSLEASARVVKDAGVKVALTVAPHGEEALQDVVRVVFWVNDYRYKVLVPQGRNLKEPIEIPENLLELGPNTLTVQAYNRAGGRGEGEVTVDFSSTQPERAAQLYGLTVGINDYSKVTKLRPPGGGSMNLEYARQDAEAMQKALQNQGKYGLFKEAHIDCLTDAQVDPIRVVDYLKNLNKSNRLKRGDRVVVFLAGHGMLADKSAPGAFVYICPKTSGQNLKGTGLTSTALHEALAELPCRKVVMIDACHAAAAAVNQARALTPDSKGCTVLAACDVNEQSGEVEHLGHGAFTQAILEALGEQFDKADLNKDGQLESRELYAYVARRVPQLVEEQHPRYHPRPLEPLIFAQKQSRPATP
jgi:WD40 repeat protein